MKLAHLVEERRDEKLPVVPLPSEQEMERRELISCYGREMRGRTRVINTLHSLFWKQGHTEVVRKDVATAAKAQEAIKVLTGQIREDAEWQIKHLELYEQRIKELKARIKETAKKDKDMKLLQNIAGVGPVVAYAFVAHVGDGSRFSKGAQVSNYLGFVPRLDYSGTIQRQGHISKRGNGYLRGLLVQAAWATVRSGKGGSLKERFQYLTMFQGKSKKKTIVSIGRRMAELMYSVLRNKTAYEVRHWKGPLNNPVALAGQARSA
jgi:transposase